MYHLESSHLVGPEDIPLGDGVEQRVGDLSGRSGHTHTQRFRLETTQTLWYIYAISNIMHNILNKYWGWIVEAHLPILFCFFFSLESVFLSEVGKCFLSEGRKCFLSEGRKCFFIKSCKVFLIRNLEVSWEFVSDLDCRILVLIWSYRYQKTNLLLSMPQQLTSLSVEFDISYIWHFSLALQGHLRLLHVATSLDN